MKLVGAPVSHAVLHKLAPLPVMLPPSQVPPQVDARYLPSNAFIARSGWAVLSNSCKTVPLLHTSAHSQGSSRPSARPSSVTTLPVRSRTLFPRVPFFGTNLGSIASFFFSSATSILSLSIAAAASPSLCLDADDAEPCSLLSRSSISFAAATCAFTNQVPILWPELQLGHQLPVNSSSVPNDTASLGPVSPSCCKQPSITRASKSLPQTISHALRGDLEPKTSVAQTLT